MLQSIDSTVGPGANQLSAVDTNAYKPNAPTVVSTDRHNISLEQHWSLDKRAVKPPTLDPNTMRRLADQQPMESERRQKTLIEEDIDLVIKAPQQQSETVQEEIHWLEEQLDAEVSKLQATLDSSKDHPVHTKDADDDSPLRMVSQVVEEIVEYVHSIVAKNTPVVTPEKRNDPPAQIFNSTDSPQSPPEIPNPAMAALLEANSKTPMCKRGKEIDPTGTPKKRTRSHSFIMVNEQGISPLKSFTFSEDTSTDPANSSKQEQVGLPSYGPTASSPSFPTATSSSPKTRPPILILGDSHMVEMVSRGDHILRHVKSGVRNSAVR